MRWLAIAVLLSACKSVAAPGGAYRINPPDSLLAAYWRSMEACTGLSGDYRRIEWFAYPGNSFPTQHSGETSGLWVSPHTIYVPEGAFTSAPWGSPTNSLVPHEMLHDLLQSGNHPPIFDKCGVR